MKFPNGYGSVYRLSGNRRRPWTARITVSHSANGWKYRYIGFFESRTDALTALAVYHEDPYDLDMRRLSFADVYRRWSEEHYPKISRTNAMGYAAAYKCCEMLYDMRFSDLKLVHLQRVIDTCGKNYPGLARIKLLFHLIYKYAQRNDLCGKDYSAYVDLSAYVDKNPNKRVHSPFTAEEIDRLWAWKDANPYISVILMLIYGGVRIGELLNLKKENVDIAGSWYDIRTSKTRAGVRRVPIADKVRPFFEYWMRKSPGPGLLSTREGKPFSYRNFMHCYWEPFMQKLGMQHTPHDTRHTCISMLVAAGVSDKVIRRIVGHKGMGVTEIVYTHFDLQTLLDAINSI